MALAPLDELHFITEALSAHVAWAKATGGYGLPACDETWLQARREHYRQTPYVAADPVEAQASAPATDATTTAPPAPLSAAESVSYPAVVTRGEALPHVSSKPVPPRPAPAPSPLTTIRDSTPSAPGSKPRPAPSTAGMEVAALVNKVEPTSDSVPRATPNVGRAVAPVTLPEKTPESSLALGVEERSARLTVLENQVRQCRDCGLCETRTNTVFARGNGSIGVAFVGEGPGADEDAQGYPFVGAAGQLLDKMIAAMGLDRESVYVCNIVKCRPPNNRKPTEEEMATCRHYVVSQLDLIQPRVIVALGATAVEGLLGLKLGITRMRGTWRLYRGSIPVMPTFHPAYLLRQPDAKREVWEDLQAVLTRLNMPLPQRRK